MSRPPMFQFHTIQEFSQWMRRQAESLQKQAEALHRKESKKWQFHRGEVNTYLNLCKLIDGGELTIQPPPAQLTAPNEAPKKERPSAANNDFLAWVRKNYSPRLYQEACRLFGNLSEDQIRKFLSEQTNDAKPGPTNGQNPRPNPDHLSVPETGDDSHPSNSGGNGRTVEDLY